jgi:hypothetical protein
MMKLCWQAKVNNLIKIVWRNVRPLRAQVMRLLMNFHVDVTKFWNQIRFLISLEISSSLLNKIHFMRSNQPARIAVRMKNNQKRMYLLILLQPRRVMAAFVLKIMGQHKSMNLNQNLIIQPNIFHQSNKIQHLLRNKS